MTLPHLLAATRVALYIRAIVRGKIGGFTTRTNLESFLNAWLSNYVLLDDHATQAVDASFPLRASSAVVSDVPGSPGAYRATLFLKPHFQLTELTASIRLVVDLPA
jgi:type VI secretion system protein ImpC